MTIQSTYRDRVGLAEHIRHTLRGAEVSQSFMIPHQGCHAMVIKNVVFDSRNLGTFTVGSHVLMISQPGQLHDHQRILRRLRLTSWSATVFSLPESAIPSCSTLCTFQTELLPGSISRGAVKAQPWNRGWSSASSSPRASLPIASAYSVHWSTYDLVV